MISNNGPSLHLGTYLGIPVKVHWSFSLLLLFIGYLAYSRQIPTSETGWFFLYVLMLFIFVVLHEYGHALAARRYGIATRDIILSPIGGIARLEKLPEKPSHELVVALAGPAVNVILSIFFLVIQLISSDVIIPSSEQLIFGSFSDFLGYLLLINVVLVIFNMLPAYPMDGGRVLRALLTMFFGDRMTATKWAVRIGQLMALIFIGIGWYYNMYMLLLIGMFVFLTARFEYRQMKLSKVMRETSVSDVLRTEYTILKDTDLIEKAISINGEHNFLVADDSENVVGSLPNSFIRHAKKNKMTDQTIKSVMSKTIGRIEEEMNLAQTFDQLNKNGWSIATVYDSAGNKKGVVDRQLLIEFINKNR